jgi:hypothetical protein
MVVRDLDAAAGVLRRCCVNVMLASQALDELRVHHPWLPAPFAGSAVHVND